MNDPIRRPHPEELSQQGLLERLRRDDEAALDVVLREYWTPLVSYLTRWLDCEDAAEDVAQRTFLRLWDRRGEWSPDGSLRALLFRMGRNLAISDRRSRSAHLRAVVRLGVEGQDRRERTPLDALEMRDLGRALERAIAELPERRREVFVLRCVQGLSYREIAEVMGISEQTVANQLSRGLATLRRSLAHLLDG